MSIIIDDDLIGSGSGGGGGGGGGGGSPGPDPRIIFSATDPGFSAFGDGSVQNLPLPSDPTAFNSYLLYSSESSRWFEWILTQNIYFGDDQDGNPIFGSAGQWRYTPAMPGYVRIGEAVGGGPGGSNVICTGPNAEGGTAMEFYTDNNAGNWVSEAADEGSTSAWFEILKAGQYEVLVSCNIESGGAPDDYIAFTVETAETNDEAPDGQWSVETQKTRYLGNVSRVGNRISGIAGRFGVNRNRTYDEDGVLVSVDGKARIKATYVTSATGDVVNDAGSTFELRRINPSPQ